MKAYNYKDLVGGSIPTGNGFCYNVLGQRVLCADIQNGTAAAGVYIDANGQPVIITGHGECDQILGCWGQQAYLNKNVKSVEYNTFSSMFAATALVGLIAILFW